MTSAIEFGLLGPLQVRRRGVEITVTAGKQRALLAALLLSTGRVVQAEELAGVLWGAVLPPSAPASLRNHMTRLRKALGEDGLQRISTRPRGYMISTRPGELDLEVFESLFAMAREQARAGAWLAVSTGLAQALALWRGEPLADVGSDALALREVPRLTEMRLQAVEERIDAELHLGRQAQVIAELQGLVSAHPMRERLRALLMLALSRDGRRGEALASYRQARHILIEELGAEPGPGLQRLHQQILNGGPAALSRQRRCPGVETPDRTILPVPAQLPHNVPGFAGREAELKEMTKLQQRPGPAVLLSAIDGSPGIGKTALAIHWAHSVANEFPDGQLYVNLQGFGPSVKLVSPAAAIRGFLCALGVPPEQMPAGFQAQAALYRSLLAGRRTLIVLDNARDETHVRPLLPGRPGCTVVVTSRRQLVGLVAADGAHPVTLNLLSEAEAFELLARRLGAGRLAAEPQAADELIRLCARLPLALAVAAARAAARPALMLEDIAAGLRASVGRLKALDVGDAATSVRVAFSWSYRHLPRKSARLFRLLGLHPGPDIDVHAAASLAEIPVQEARELLQDLVHANLLWIQASGRFTFHDLLRTYACELARDHESDEARHTALTRLFDHYLAAAAAAMDVLVPAERHRRPRPLATAGPVPPLATAASARLWLDTERATLIAVIACAATSGWPSHATRLAVTLFRYLDNGGYHAEAITVHTHALHASRQSGDRAAQADALRNLGAVAWWQSRCKEAMDYFRQALALYRDLADGLGQARALANLALALGHEGRYAEAVTHHRDALAIFRDLGDNLGQARTLDNLGVVVCRLGRYAEAVACHREALSMFRELDERVGEAGALGNLGTVLRGQGHHSQAAVLQRRALRLFREIGHRDAEAETLNSLGRTLRAQGCCQDAVHHHRGALDLYRELGNLSGQAVALNDLGEAFSTRGECEQARIHHEEALRLADQAGSLEEKARAHEALARVFRTDGDIAQARRQLQHSLAIYTRLDIPGAANQIAAALRTLGSG